MNSPTAIKTFTGLFFDPLNPDPALITIEDIAHALARQTRFSGHVRGSWSVANHSLLVSRMVCDTAYGFPGETLWALLHDATEAYLIDLPTPLKSTEDMTAFREIEYHLHEAIADRFRLQWPMPDCVRSWDAAALWAESTVFANGYRDWNYQPITTIQRMRVIEAKEAILGGAGQSLVNRTLGPLGLYSPGSVERMFLREFRRLIGVSGKRAA